MADNNSRSAKWDNVRFDMNAMKHHALAFERGHRYELAKMSYQYIKLMEQKTGQKIDLLEEE